MEQNAKGFGVVETVVVILVVALVGFGGWYLFNKRTNQATLSSSSQVTWKDATLANEKLHVQYPSDWTFNYTSPSSAEISASRDIAFITAPNGLQVTITTGGFFVEHPQYAPNSKIAVVDSKPIQTLGGNYYLNFVTVNDALYRVYVSQSQNPKATGLSSPSDTDYEWPVGKNITLKKAQPSPLGSNTYLEIGLSYKQAANNATAETYQKDKNFAVAKQIIESIHY